MINDILKGLKESLFSVGPVVIVVLLLYPFIDLSIKELELFLVCSVILMLGLSIFTSGAEKSMMLIGEKIGKSIMKTKNLFIILVVVFLMGTIITIAEPDLRVLAGEVSIPNWILIMAVAFGIGLFLYLGSIRVFYNLSLSKILLIFYTIAFVLVCFVNKDNIAICFDAGGVTTGPISAPFIMAMGAGLCFNKASKSLKEDTFGLIGLCSVGPIITVLLLCLLFKPTGIFEFNSLDIDSSIINVLISNYPTYLKEVSLAVLPIIIIFIIFSLISKEFTKDDLIKITFGLILTIIGLSIFLTSVNTGFSSVGYMIGKTIGNTPFKYVLIPLTMIFGFLMVKAEPAVKILNTKIEEITSGSITKKTLEMVIATGVSVALALSTIKIIFDIPILYFLVPVYLGSIILSFKVPKIFTSVAFDAGGVVAGPLTVTFLLPLEIGLSSVLYTNITEYAFGIVALIAMTPPLTIQALGLVYKMKLNKQYKDKNIDESIIEYNIEDLV